MYVYSSITIVNSLLVQYHYVCSKTLRWVFNVMHKPSNSVFSTQIFLNYIDELLVNCYE